MVLVAGRCSHDKGLVAVFLLWDQVLWRRRSSLRNWSCSSLIQPLEGCAKSLGSGKAELLKVVEAELLRIGTKNSAGGATQTS